MTTFLEEFSLSRGILDDTNMSVLEENHISTFKLNERYCGSSIKLVVFRLARRYIKK